MEESLIDLSSTPMARDDRYLKAAMSRNARQAYESDLNDLSARVVNYQLHLGDNQLPQDSRS